MSCLRCSDLFQQSIHLLQLRGCPCQRERCQTQLSLLRQYKYMNAFNRPPPSASTRSLEHTVLDLRRLVVAERAICIHHVVLYLRSYLYTSRAGLVVMNNFFMHVFLMICRCEAKNICLSVYKRIYLQVFLFFLTHNGRRIEGIKCSVMLLRIADFL